MTNTLSFSFRLHYKTYGVLYIFKNVRHLCSQSFDYCVTINTCKRKHAPKNNLLFLYAYDRNCTTLLFSYVLIKNKNCTPKKA